MAKDFIVDLDGDGLLDIVRVYNRKKGGRKTKVANVKFGTSKMKRKKKKREKGGKKKSVKKLTKHQYDKEAEFKFWEEVGTLIRKNYINIEIEPATRFWGRGTVKKNGWRYAVAVSGNTYPIKDPLKKLGFVWRVGQWVKPVSSQKDALKVVGRVKGIHLNKVLKPKFRELKAKYKGKVPQKAFREGYMEVVRKTQTPPEFIMADLERVKERVKKLKL